MTDIRAQAAKAAREWRDKMFPHSTGTPLDGGSGEYFIDGFTQGHAAGVADGARGFADELAKDVKGTLMRDWLVEHWEAFSSNLASRPAPGTGLAQGNDEEGA